MDWQYHPYGTTSYQAVNASINAVAKRYRYTGKERDEESGLYYHGARYYIPWLCRWTAVDPMEAKYTGMSPYNYAFNNPAMFNDPSGMEGEGFKQSNPINLDEVSIIGRHPVHDKI
ncbi:RHS repeat-associated core domain-containing protein [Edaphocola flava]|uniref:RHS repeat-associated core domain-containing protein n=1 Tax=Edaphocola flava TaxID=2499629 RepID=UPI00100BED4C|nr:RHS repeat-associated core domain-containing protein [Edaphocola flava]